MLKNTIKIKDNFAPLFQDSSLVCNNYDLLNTLTELLSEGKANEALHLLNNLQKSVAGHHPLYPYYSTAIEIRDGRFVFVSKPNSPEAIEKYPPTYKVKMVIPEKYKDFSSITELLDYSYKNQVDIDVNVTELKKLLGNEEDPFQDEIFNPENLENIMFKIKPKEFPPSKPFKIVFVNTNYVFDYILLKVERITDDDKIILSNMEQQSGLYISFTLDFKNNKLDFNIKIKEGFLRDVTTNLALIKLMINARKENQLEVISLEDRQKFMSGYLNGVNFTSKFGDEEREKKFLEDLKVIENFYNTKIELADNIVLDDVMNAEMLAKGITKKESTGKYDNIEAEFRITNETRDSIKDINNKSFMLSFEIHNYEIKIFNKKFEIPKIIQTIKKVRIEDEDKLLRKMEVLEAGDIIKIKFIPADEETIEYVNEFYFE